MNYWEEWEAGERDNAKGQQEPNHLFPFPFPVFYPQFWVPPGP